ncbi:MAG: Uma2 family endonuclease, partial [Saprospiraceae bacterium]|nr:Uma2 family endonuclease [Saprospiraceae bacterium]
KIHIEIGLWNKMTNLGETFDSSTGFTLSNGAERSPDTAWIARERWEALPNTQKQSFAPIVPDFVVELRSSSDNLAVLKLKMAEYMACGCRLGWLVDPQNTQTLVYHENNEVETVAFNQVLTGGDVMPGLEVTLAEVLGI